MQKEELRGRGGTEREREGDGAHGMRNRDMAKDDKAEP